MESFDPDKTGFTSIENISKIILFVILRFWKLCSAALLFLFLLYWLYGGIVTLLLLSTALCGALYHYQDTLLYFPDQPENSRIFVQSPRFLGLPYENIHVKTSDGVLLNGIFLKQSGNRLSIAPTILMFHGNAGNIGHRLINAQVLYSYTGSNVFLLEYRGYGKSHGVPSEKGFELDAIAAVEYLLTRSDIDHEKIVVYGRSLGGAVAFSVASIEKYMTILFAVMVENTFTSIPDMSRHLFSWLTRLPYFFYKNTFPSIDRVNSISTPTLFLSGLNDQLVPPEQMRRLYNASGAYIKRIETFESGTHNETWQCHNYTDAINRFLNDVYEARKNGQLPSNQYRQSRDNNDNRQSIINI